jgi:hypothetical protein
MADSEILYVVKADGKQAIDTFNKLGAAQNNVAQKTALLQKNTQNSNMLLMSTGRIVQDMPYGFMAIGNNITFMAEQMGYMKTQGMSAKDMLIGMGKAMIGPMGVIFAISAITSAITYFTSNIGKGKSAVDSFTSSVDKAIKKLIDFQDPLKNLKFGLDPQQLEKLIPAIEKEIKAIENLNTMRQTNIGVQSGVSAQGFNAGLILNQLTAAEKEQIKLNEQTLTQLKNIKSEYEAQLKVAKLLEGLGLTKVEAEEKTKELLKDQLKIIEEMASVIAPSRRGERQLPAERAGRTPLQGPQNQIINVEQLKEDFSQVNLMVMTSADILRGEFMSAWEDIFGEANSLFEKLMARFADNLFMAGIDFLSNVALGFFSGLFGEGSSKNPQVINVNLGNETLERVVVKGNYEAQRLRLT